MGFTTGFTGGVTLTLGLAYITVLAHERNRQAQAQNLRSQSRVLTSLLEPTPLPPPQSRSELAREGRGTLVETAKDRWNEEVENAVRWVQRTDWGEVREGMEGAVSRLLGSGLQKSREGIEQAENKSAFIVEKGAKEAEAKGDRAAATTIAGAEKAGAAVKEGVTKAVGAINSSVESAVTSTKVKLGQAGDKISGSEPVAKGKANRGIADAKSTAHDAADAIKNTGSTVGAARGAVRDTINKGIEKSKEAIGRAQAAVGLAADKLESKGQATILSHSSAVEKALRERFEEPKGLDKSVEDALAERYKPIDSRDDSVLKGV